MRRGRAASVLRTPLTKRNSQSPAVAACKALDIKANANCAAPSDDGAGPRRPAGGARHVVRARMEHHSVRQPCKRLGVVPVEPRTASVARRDRNLNVVSRRELEWRLPARVAAFPDAQVAGQAQEGDQAKRPPATEPGYVEPGLAGSLELLTGIRRRAKESLVAVVDERRDSLGCGRRRNGGFRRRGTLAVAAGAARENAHYHREDGDARKHERHRLNRSAGRPDGAVGVRPSGHLGGVGPVSPLSCDIHVEYPASWCLPPPALSATAAGS
jgi:hypothetical protein